MYCTVRITICIAIISSLIIKNSNASLEIEKKHFNGLLSDVLQVHHLNNLQISSACDKQLILIQNNLDVRNTWAIKRK